MSSISLEQHLSRRDVLGWLGRGIAAIAVAPAIALALEGEAEARFLKPPLQKAPAYRLNTSHQLPKNRTRRRRETPYIILHSTEGEFAGSLGKIRRQANANYLVDRNGTVHSIVHRDHRANHAGKSMWEGRKNLSDISVGIEIVGYHYAPFTDAQYRAVRALVGGLQHTYHVPDKNVLGHYQIAFGSNRFTGWKKARGRKKDGINLDWKRLGIVHRTDDPDARAGRIKPDPYLAALLAKEQRNGKRPQERVKEVYGTTGSNVITAGKSAWSIAGGEYNDAGTFYVFPDKIVREGKTIKKHEWDNIPAGTRVFVNTTLDAVLATLEPVLTLRRGETAWEKVQTAYNDADTCYISPAGKIIKGNLIDAHALVAGTRIVLDCAGPYVTDQRRTPLRIAGEKYKTDRAVYVLPDGNVKTGTSIQNFSALQKGTRLLVRGVGR